MATTDAAPPQGISVPDESKRASGRSATGRRSVRIRGRDYPIILPSLRDPRLHVAAVLLTLQVLGQTVLDFRLSVAQILVCLAAGALIEFVVAFFKDKVIMWPASGLLTGNSAAFILRVPGTVHGHWWSTHGIWIFVGVVAISMASKYLIRWRGRHIFNPSNLGLVIAFVALGPQYTEPQDLWWIPMGPWLIVTYAILIGGGLLIGWELNLLGLMLGFMVAFAAFTALALAPVPDHCMVASWHATPMCGRELWTILVTSPELLIFAFFMVPDPRTVPEGQVARLVFGVLVALLAVLLLGPTTLEFWTKTAILASLVVACALRFPVAAFLAEREDRYAPEPAILRGGWRVPALIVLTALAMGLVPLASAASTTGPEPGPGLPDGSKPAVALTVGSGPTVAIWAFETAVTALPPQASSGPGAASARVWVLPPIPPVSISPKVSAFDPSMTPQTAASMAHDAVVDLMIESEARRSHDFKLAELGATGDGLTEFTDVIRDDITAGKIIQKTYSFDQVTLNLFLPKFSSQARRLVGVSLHGTATLTTRDASGNVLSQSTVSYSKSWGIAGGAGLGAAPQPGTNQIIINDYTDLVPA